jgi:hypothetical protein
MTGYLTQTDRCARKFRGAIPSLWLPSTAISGTAMTHTQRATHAFRNSYAYVQKEALKLKVLQI